MIIVVCHIPRLDLNDITPRIRLVQGKSHPIPRVAYHKSLLLQAAIVRGDVTVGVKPAQVLLHVLRAAAPPKHTAPRRRTRPVVLPAPDLSELRGLIADLKSVHTLFMGRAEEPQTSSPVVVPDKAVLELLTTIHFAVQGISDRISILEQRPIAVHQSEAVPTQGTQTPSDTPVYIPSDIRTGSPSDSRINVETTKDGSDLSEAEEALRNLQKPKRKRTKPRRKKNG